MTITATPAPTDEEIQLLNELLVEYSGLAITEHRRRAVLRYVSERLVQLNLSSVTEYYRCLRFSARARIDLNALVQLLTVNETYFFREAYQFENLFGGALLPPPSALPRSIRILSAGCSSGEEPYSLSIFAQEAGYRTSMADVSIDGFDIHPERIAIAMEGKYRRASLRAFDEEKSARYFDAAEDDTVAVKRRYRSGVRFSVGNVLDLSTYPDGGIYDAIFCRNVFIYFTERSLRTAIANFACCLKPGGSLFLGHSESIIGLTDDFRPARVGNHIVYRRTDRLSGRSLATAWGLLG